MYQSTDRHAPISTTETPNPEPAVPAFLADLSQDRLGEYIAVHTSLRTYMGRLLSVSGICVVLDADSDSLDDATYLRIDTSRIEAVELLQR
jgi:hypothetical protein